MFNTTNWPATVRELGDMAIQRGLKLSELLEELERDLGPMPRPPAEYNLAPKSDELWIADETINRGWILTPGWRANTGHSINLWTVNHRDLTPSEALELSWALKVAALAGIAAEGGQAG